MKIISGKEIASSIYDELKVKIEYLKTLNIIPGLAVVLVGERIDSQTYVNMKVKKCMELGIISRQVKFESDVSESLSKSDKGLNNSKSTFSSPLMYSSNPGIDAPPPVK